MIDVILAAAISLAVNCDLPPKDFRAFYAAENGPGISDRYWMGAPYEQTSLVNLRMMNTLADYADYIRMYQLSCGKGTDARPPDH